MLVYLSKKFLFGHSAATNPQIAIPHNTPLKSLAWSSSKGWIACGGVGGLLKVLKLEPQQGANPKGSGLAAPSNLTMNQSLAAHDGSVEVVKWNEQYCKLTSSDQHGLIVVWTMYKGQWCEEMINNRNRSVVKDMSWTKDGQKICIVYEDGAIIVGSFDGTRLWGKDLKGMQLTHVQWSPNAKRILFGNSRGEVMIHDSQGNFIANLSIVCLANVTGAIRLSALEWYNGASSCMDASFPCLAVCFENGRVQIMKHELDTDPVKIDTGIVIQCASWSPKGSILAIGGAHQSSVQDREFNIIQFYSLVGEHLHSLRVPGKSLPALSWEASSLRMALAVDSFIYFANIRHDYKWGYFANTVVYAFKRHGKEEDVLVFWNTRTSEKQTKSIKNLLQLTTCTDLCVLAVRPETSDKEYALLLCNSLGTPVDARYIHHEPVVVSISYNYVVAASSSVIYLWHYRTTTRLERVELVHAIGRMGREGKEWIFHVDEMSTGVNELLASNARLSEPTSDPICAACVSDKRLLVARTSGTLQCYSLPKMVFENKYLLNCRPATLDINSDSSLLAATDVDGVLSVYDLAMKGVQAGQIERLASERKEVWDFKWAEDNPEMYAVMEKTRMYIFRRAVPEEPVQSSGHICEFRDLKVKTILMDEILMDPDNPAEDCIIDFETKSLRDTQDLLEKVGLQEAYQFVEDNPHNQLWTLTAESALNQLNFEIAERCYVKCEQYPSIQFVKKISRLDSEVKQKAEVAAFLKRFDEAERIYLDMDRRDLAVDLRMRMGDWFRVVQLLKTGGGAGDDSLLSGAWNAIGDYYFERQKFSNAITYYSQGQNYSRLLECYFTLEDFAGLQRLGDALPDCHPLLQDLAKKLASFGMCSEAASMYVKAGEIQKAVDTCVYLNHWDLALKVAEQHQLPDIDKLLSMYVVSLLEKKKVFSAITLYMKAKQHLEAAKLIFKIAKKLQGVGVSPLLLKKLYVLGGLFVEQHMDSIRNAHAANPGREGTSATLRGLALADSVSSTNVGIIDKAWRGAEAYHLYLLAQRQWYEGNPDATLRTALVLRDYEDYIPPQQIYSLLALSSAVCQSFGWSSKAFIRLESLDGLDEKERQLYENTALEIFTRHSPRDSSTQTTECPSCGNPVQDWDTCCEHCSTKFPVCMVTGQPLMDYEVWLCATCKHRASERDIASYNNCPLCHSCIYSL